MFDYRTNPILSEKLITVLKIPTATFLGKFGANIYGIITYFFFMYSQPNSFVAFLFFCQSKTVSKIIPLTIFDSWKNSSSYYF